MYDDGMISACDIQAPEKVIRSHIRRTPVLACDGAYFGLTAQPLTLKLELLQHAGSFKTRGAFTNLLTAVSGSNHGAAVAYSLRCRCDLNAGATHRGV
jgi:threonine dehydratase